MFFFSKYFHKALILGVWLRAHQICRIFHLSPIHWRSTGPRRFVCLLCYFLSLVVKHFFVFLGLFFFFKKKIFLFFKKSLDFTRNSEQSQWTVVMRLWVGPAIPFWAPISARSSCACFLTSLVENRVEFGLFQFLFLWSKSKEEN